MFNFKNKYEKFWDWFLKNSEMIFYFEKNIESTFEQISKQIKKVNPDLTFEIGAVMDNQRREFVVSADGIKSSFPDVIDLVDKAPDLGKWEIVAFRPRKNIKETILKIHNIELDPNKLFFEYRIEEDNKISVDIYIPDLTQENERPIFQGIMILLDTALGEFDVETKLQFIDIKKLENDLKKESLYPFVEITAIVDDFFKNRRVQL